MKKLFLLAIITIITYSISFSQGTIRGKITDNNGESLIGVTIYLKANHGIGTTTDLDGTYSLKINDSIAQTLVVSYISYKTIEQVVNPAKGQVLIKNFTLIPSSQEIKVAEVSAKAVKAKDYYLESIKKKSATTIDYVSSETMKKTGDANVTTAIARVSGVSTNNGGFITVRGIGDRYVKTSINGLRIPTLDPFTNNIKLDIFPASLVDNIMITKTASPDLAGDWAGAYISVETKDYPEQLAINVETKFGYNNQSTLTTVLSSQRSSTDWMGYDNNLRGHNHSDFNPATINPNPYQEFVALGLESYYNSIGVNETTPWNETYYKLGLVQLGLLGIAQINDQEAYTTAKSAYENGTYKGQAFNTLNANAANSGQSFANNWNTQTRETPLNFTQSLSIGNQVQLFKRPLGFMVGFRYGMSNLYDPNSTANRAGVVGDANGNLIPSVTSAVNQQVAVETNGWSGLINLAYKLNPNNSFSVLFMPNLTGTNRARNAIDDRDISNNVITKSQYYEERKQLIYQYKSSHYIPSIKLRTELDASYTNGKSEAPDFKNLQYSKDPVSNTYQIGATTLEGIHRYYRYLSDDLFDSHVSFEFPLSAKPDLIRKLKFGGAYQSNNKTNDQYDYIVNSGAVVYPLHNDDLDAYFDLSHFGISNYTDANGHNFNTMDFYYSESASAANHTFGTSKIIAGFVMADYSITTKLRFAGGLRIEKADILTDVVKFDSLGLPYNDPRRAYDSGLPVANPGKLNETSYLPGINAIYKLKDNEQSQINLRANYSQSVARPSIRELSDVATFDYEFRSFVYGNSDLKMVHINNYDLRLESYFKSGDNVSVSLFYKAFKNHIELVKSNGYSWQNVDKSHVAGIELEGKKVLTKNFDLNANVTLANSETKFVRTRLEISSGIKNYIPVDTLTRTMYGQAPYVVNGILSYHADSIGLTLTLSYNIQGKRLVIASDNKEVPDIYEQPRNLLDFKVSKNLGRHFIVSLTIRDVLNTSIVRSYNYTDGTNLDYDKYSFGTNYELGVIYKL
ncbi:MAG: carboxypeptidase-like regulatory domain-containing protein [Bacteroidia bacterium]